MLRVPLRSDVLSMRIVTGVVLENCRIALVKNPIGSDNIRPMSLNQQPDVCSVQCWLSI